MQPISHVIDLYIIPIWALFYIYWVGSAAYDLFSGRSKKVSRQSTGMERMWNLFLGLALLLVVIEPIRMPYPLNVIILPSSYPILLLGMAIALSGIFFAIWARRHLGGNWSSVVEQKVGQEFIETGPYAIVRHPIYTGIMVGVVGSFIMAGSLGGLLAIPAALIFSLARISAEEKLMVGTFGQKYLDYRKRVKALVPRIW